LTSKLGHYILWLVESLPFICYYGLFCFGMSSSSLTMAKSKLSADKFNQPRTKQSFYDEPTLFALPSFSLSPLNEENKLLTGFITNSLARTCTQKLLGTRLSLAFSMTLGLAEFSSITISLFSWFTVTVRLAVRADSAVLKLENLLDSGVV